MGKILGLKILTNIKNIGTGVVKSCKCGHNIEKWRPFDVTYKKSCDLFVQEL